MSDDPLTPEERAAFEQLSRASAPPPHLENRVVAAIRRAGHLPPVRRYTAWLRIAAVVALVLGGVLIGRLTTAPSPASSRPAYLLLLYGGESLPDEEAARVAEYTAWAGTLAARDQLVVAERLAPEARALGSAPPAASAQPVGFFLIRADSVEAATAVAASCPHLKYGGTVVLRPVG